MEDISFFDEQTISSRVKASIVSEYFPKYCKIITLKHKPQRIGYFDLFSGPGLYKDEKPSTPILIADKCKIDDYLRSHVWMVFNDKTFSDELKYNFEKYFPQGTFSFSPHFGHSVVGENEEINNFIVKDHTKGRFNECPSVLFIDPFGYKGIDTKILSTFLSYWGNELFIFINSKRINAAIDNEKFEPLMRCLFPLNFDVLKNTIRNIYTVQERLNFIIDKIGLEFNQLINTKVKYTAFKFQEEDIQTTSHYILHLTKSARGFDLIKQIYTDFANVGTIFDGINTYTFDPKKYNSTASDLFDTSSDNIDILKEKIYNEFQGKTINALDLFEKHQINELYSRRHYAAALRRLVKEGKIDSKFVDKKNHDVKVLLIKECILNFK